MKKQLGKAQEEQFVEVLNQIQTAKQQAFQQVNETLVQLYWNIGKYISEQIEEAHWGKGVVLELANYIQTNAPDLKGFSDKNLWRMKQFYEVYGDNQKLSTLWRVLPSYCQKWCLS